MAQQERALLLRHPLALTGIGLATGAAVVFITLTIAKVVGLLLIPWGVTLQRRAIARGEKSQEWPVIDFRKSHTRRVALIIASLTAVNVVIFLLAGYGTLRWMESPQFCGQVCHEPMHPQYTAWQNATHSNIACVQCHIGEGAEAFVHYKTAGLRQLFHVVTKTTPDPSRA